MKKSIFILILTLALLGLVACDDSSPSEQPNAANISLPKASIVPTTVPSPEKGPFTASVSVPVPSQVKTNELFTVEATLSNLTETNFKLLHASGVFYFSITDSNGKGVNTFVMPQVGIFRNMEGSGTITEPYTYKLEKPGRYEVSASAKFTVGEGNNTEDYELETNKVSIEVTQ